MKLGLALFLLLFVQLLLAQAGRTLNKRRGNRYLSFVHIVTGIVLFALSVWNVHEGFKIWPAINQGPKWQPPRYASYIVRVLQSPLWAFMASDTDNLCLRFTAGRASFSSFTSAASRSCQRSSSVAERASTSRASPWREKTSPSPRKPLPDYPVSTLYLNIPEQMSSVRE